MNITLKDIDWKSLLVKKYLHYDLNEIDVMVLFVSEAVLDMQEKTLVTCDILSPYMKCAKDDIDTSLSKLMTKKIITIVQEGVNFYSSIEEFKLRLFREEIKDLTLRGSDSVTNVVSENLYSYLESIGGPLSPVEKDRVMSWLKEGADETMVKEACKRSLTKNGHISFNNADHFILEMERRASRKNIGVSTIDENDRKNDAMSRAMDSKGWEN